MSELRIEFIASMGSRLGARRSQRQGLRSLSQTSRRSVVRWDDQAPIAAARERLVVEEQTIARVPVNE